MRTGWRLAVGGLLASASRLPSSRSPYSVLDSFCKWRGCGFPCCKVSLQISNRTCRNSAGGPVVKNLPSNAGVMVSVPGQGTKIPHAMGQGSPSPPIREGHAPQRRACASKKKSTCRIPAVFPWLCLALSRTPTGESGLCPLKLLFMVKDRGT